MKRRVRYSLLLSVSILACTVTASTSGGQQPASKADEQQGSEESIVLNGYVRDAACLFRNPAAGTPATDESKDCTTMCLRAGGPLVVYTPAGDLYLVISRSIPDTAENARFLPYVGKLLRLEGHAFQRAGIRAIAIEKFAVIPAGP